MGRHSRDCRCESARGGVLRRSWVRPSTSRCAFGSLALLRSSAADSPSSTYIQPKFSHPRAERRSG
eukprot:scaffold132491_cov31-Tisochrysis_lutea.AAC.5